MSNIKLKNASGVETTYSGVTSVKIPLADGSGNATFSQEAYKIIVQFTSVSETVSATQTISCTYNGSTKTRSELGVYTSPTTYGFTTFQEFIEWMGFTYSSSVKTAKVWESATTGPDKSCYYGSSIFVSSLNAWMPNYGAKATSSSVYAYFDDYSDNTHYGISLSNSATG